MTVPLVRNANPPIARKPRRTKRIDFYSAAWRRLDSAPRARPHRFDMQGTPLTNSQSHREGTAEIGNASIDTCERMVVSLGLGPTEGGDEYPILRFVDSFNPIVQDRQ
ncbi:hypothetical protein V2G26_017417 [Clonostachys chloroleuca]